MALAVQTSLEDLSTPLFDVTFCVLDIETTGGSPAVCDITELGAVKYRGGELLAEFHTLVDPGTPIPASITVLTGITRAMVAGAPSITEVLPVFLEFLGGSIVVGHNVRFDLSFLKRAAAELGYPPLRGHVVDTAALARRLVRDEVRNLRLSTLSAHFRSPILPTHRALDDARATAHVLHALIERAGTLGVTSLDDLIQLPTAKGAAHYRKIRLTEELPRQPGVYVFRDRGGHPIYVGKAANLRVRVRQYFYGDQRRRIADLMRQLESIDYQVCSTPLEAEVAELRLIQAHRPRFNQRSKRSKTALWVSLTRERYPRLSIVRSPSDDALAHLGPFRSRRAAQLNVAALWDATPIRRCSRRLRGGGLEKASGSCAPAQLGVAYCPCAGEVDEAAYRDVVNRVLEGINADPSLLLEPLVQRMARLASEQRYEEAAWARDRRQALARAIESRLVWQALAGSGICELESSDGECVLIDRGRLVVTWRRGDHAPLFPMSSPEPEPTEVPGSLEAAEEAALMWRWIATRELRVIGRG